MWVFLVQFKVPSVFASCIFNIFYQVLKYMGVQEGAEQASPDGTSAQRTESCDSPRDSHQQCPGPTVSPALGEHFGLIDPTCPPSACVQVLGASSSHTGGAQRGAGLHPKSHSWREADSGFQPRTVGLQSPSSSPGITQPLPGCQPGEP